MSTLRRHIIAVTSALYGIALPSVALAQTASSQVTAQTASGAVDLKAISKIAPAEKAVTAVSKKTVKHAAPSANFQSVLKDVPGMNVISSGPGNLSATDNEFTYQGFTSAQMASNFDGVPIINTFRGGAGGTGDDHAFTPLSMGQFSSVKVYSGANQPSQNGINSLGGTISYEPSLPTSRFYFDLNGSGGKYNNIGGEYTSGISINSGIIPGTKTEMLFKYSYTHAPSFQRNVYADINSYYGAIVQPYDHGLSQLKLIALYNNEQARQPSLVPLSLLDRFGSSYQPPLNVAYSATHTQAVNIILSWKSILNRYMLAKTKFFVEQQDDNRTSFTNSAYYDPNHYGYAFYQGYPVGTDLEPYAAPPTANNLYNPVALFGSAVNGTQYHNYIDNIHSFGFLPSITFFIPHNTVQFGALSDFSQDHSAEYWYGSSPVPDIEGYNDAWNEHDQRNYNYIYLQDNISLLRGRLHLYPGVKYNIVSTGDDDQAGYYYTFGGHVGNTYYFTEPSFGISYSPLREINLFFSAGRTNKVPNISAYYSVIGAGPIPGPITVQPEGDTSYDFGIRYSGPMLRASLSFFRRNFTNIFSEFYDAATGQTFEYNNGSALYQGLTFVASAPIEYGFSLFGSYNYTSAKYTKLSVGANGTAYPGEYRPYIPTYTASAGLRFKKGNLYASLDGHFVGRQYIATNKGETIGLTLPSYDTLDFTASYKYPVNYGGIKSILFSLYADNILNNNYLSYLEEETSPISYLQGQPGAPVFVGGRVRVRF
ncbi:TonB-dependent receptor [Acidithiobacillus caldus]|uniref:TonB-dependent receptor n=1 Tax=Acidithiobacillus caldus TaxID=33059 RepID=UPI0007F54D36|nr:TonB-dependent receptor [Acidithiobacillus caldus]QER46027.1 hypothetical protein F0726_02981 [Acidithiobacillus caldus]